MPETAGTAQQAENSIHTNKESAKQILDKDCCSNVMLTSDTKPYQDYKYAQDDGNGAA
jgi:hypothetical protein